MVKTIEEAKKCWCCRHIGSLKCSAGERMAWEWEIICGHGSGINATPTTRSTIEGYCNYIKDLRRQ